MDKVGEGNLWLKKKELKKGIGQEEKEQERETDATKPG